MQIIVTVLSSSQNLLADMMLEAAAAAPRSENTPLATPLSDEDTCFYHRPLDSDWTTVVQFGLVAVSTIYYIV